MCSCVENIKPSEEERNIMRVCDYISNFVADLGVSTVFLVSGGGMMFLSDGIKKNKRLNFVCNHHEQASAMAAVAYAKATRSIGVAFVTTGCGGTNAITGLLHAWQDSTPCIFISGQIKRKETIRNSVLPLRQLGIQEADIIAIVESISKYSIMVNDPQMIPYHFQKAAFLAKTGRPGPVWLDIPMDVQSSPLDIESAPGFDPVEEGYKSYKTTPIAGELEAVVNALRKAQRPVIVAGQGIWLSKSEDLLRRFVEANDIPVVFPRMGINNLETSHRLHIGKIGTKGDRAGNLSIQNADLVLSIGSRLSVSSTGQEYELFAREAKLYVVDIDPIEHKKGTVRIDLFINADAKEFFSAMGDLRFTDASVTQWATRCLKWKLQYPVCTEQHRQWANGVSMYNFVDRLSHCLPDDAIIISDAGSSVFVVSQALKLRRRQVYITSGGQAEMGFSLPGSIGASFAGRGLVAAVTGDGSFQMNIQELQTVVHYNLPIKLFIWNNGGYLSISATQKKFFNGDYIGTSPSSGVSFPSILKIANAYGITYRLIDDSSTITEKISEILSIGGPVVCEVICGGLQEVMPVVSSYQRNDGKLVSRPLEDMYPFLDREEMKSNLFVDPIIE
jgi:acetolactate synthase-1/2/3 large subunit